MKNEEQRFAAEVMSRNPLYQRLCKIYPAATAKHVIKTHTETDLRYMLGMDWLKKNNSPFVSGSLEIILSAIREHFRR